MSGGGGGVDAVLHAQRNRGGGAAHHARGHVVADDFEQVQTGMQRLPHQQFKRALGGFEFVALILQVLDALQQMAAAFVVEHARQAGFIEFVDHAAAAGKVAQQNALAVADGWRAKCARRWRSPSARR